MPQPSRHAPATSSRTINQKNSQKRLLAGERHQEKGQREALGIKADPTPKKTTSALCLLQRKAVKVQFGLRRVAK